MRPLFVAIVLITCSRFAAPQTAPPPQSARQALIEMFFGTAPNHF